MTSIKTRSRFKRRRRRRRRKRTRYIIQPRLRDEAIIVQELCENRGGRPGLFVLTSLLVSVDVKLYQTVLRHWSQLVPNMSTDIRGQHYLPDEVIRTTAQSEQGSERQRRPRDPPTPSPLTPSLPQPVKCPGWKMHGRACKQYIFRSCVTPTFSAVNFDESPFTYQCEKEDKKA